MLQSGRLPGGRNFDEHDDEFRSGVPPLHECRAHFDHVDRELLGELAARGVEQTLAFVDLSTGELPEPSVSLVRRTTADEIAAIATDHGSQNANVGGRAL